ncbi:MAG: preprotein translocase subunit SecY [Bacilli bacterium]|nr:preprotein translocase subunit SecY [Bacilli bacterium]HPZ26733.1 preprotein translocase subunit SecY [Bacilli bacterium]HQC89202.1 preprotein translocase subunit SecY [Bacilli bacterium]
MAKYKKIIKMFLYTALILLVWRLAYHVQLPMIDRELLSSEVSLFGFLDIFSGGALSNYSIVALGISPYITASIVIQLLQMDIVPTLKEWAEEGEVGRKKLNQLTRYLALALAFIQALTVSLGIVAYYGDIFELGVDATAFTYVYLALVMTAGTAFILWMAEKITAKGIGNGTSMFIVAGIVAGFPLMIQQLIGTYITKENGSVGDIFVFFGILLLLIVIIIGVVFMESAVRKIPIQYANRPAAAAFRGRSESHVPIKLNVASVIPVIFASTLMSLPATIVRFLDMNNVIYWIGQIFDYTQPIGFVLYIVLIYLFTFFYSFLQMNPEKVAENLQKQNAYIPGIRPGAETASYLSRVLFKITIVGATYLALVASLPIIISFVFDLPESVRIGGTSLIIVVGVAIETAKQIKTTAQEKQYRGFID